MAAVISWRLLECCYYFLDGYGLHLAGITMNLWLKTMVAAIPTKNLVIRPLKGPCAMTGKLGESMKDEYICLTIVIEVNLGKRLHLGFDSNI